MAADGTDTRTDRPSPTQNLASFSAVLLALFTIVSFTANVFLVSTILSSTRLRRSVINYFLVHIAVANLLDTLLGMVITLVKISMGVDWSIGKTLCNINAAVGQLVLIMTVAGLTVLSIDRCIALTHTASYRQTFSPLRAAMALLTAWLIGLSFVVPILFGSIKADIYLYRNFCSIAEGNDLVYIICVIVICYIFPLAIMLCSSAVIFMKARVDRLNRRPNSDLRFSHPSFIVEARRFQDHLALSKFTIALIILFALLEGPYILLNAVILVRNSKDVKDSISTAKFTADPESKTAVTCLRFVFPVVYPFLVFGFCKDIWKKFQDLICCKRSNMIRTAMTSSPDSPAHDRANSDYPNALTLVATGNGLATIADGPASGSYVYADLQNRQQEGANFDEIERSAATSDYGSEDGNSGGNDAEGHSLEHPSHRRVSQPDRNGENAGEVIEGNIRKTRMEVIENQSFEYTDDPEDEDPEQVVALSSSQLIISPPQRKTHGRAASDSIVSSMEGLRSILKRPSSFLTTKIATLPGNISMEGTMEEPGSAKRGEEKPSASKELILTPTNLQNLPSDFSSSEVEDTVETVEKKLPGLKLPPIPTNTAFAGVPDVNSLDFTTTPPETAVPPSPGGILNPQTELPVTRYSNRFKNTMGVFAKHKLSRPRKTQSSTDLTARVTEAQAASESGDRKAVSADASEAAKTHFPTFPKRKFRPQQLGAEPVSAWNAD